LLALHVFSGGARGGARVQPGGVSGGGPQPAEPPVRQTAGAGDGADWRTRRPAAELAGAVRRAVRTAAPGVAAHPARVPAEGGRLAPLVLGARPGAALDRPHRRALLPRPLKNAMLFCVSFQHGEKSNHCTFE